MKNLYYDMSEYIEENYRLKQNKSINNYDIALDLNGSFEIISKENNNNEKLKASLGSNVSNRTTYKNP
jgi:hypothetical protein